MNTFASTIMACIFVLFSFVLCNMIIPNITTDLKFSKLYGNIHNFARHLHSVSINANFLTIIFVLIFRVSIILLSHFLKLTSLYYFDVQTILIGGVVIFRVKQGAVFSPGMFYLIINDTVFFCV